MTNTRAINSVVWTNTLSVNETTTLGADPTLAAGLPSLSSAGQQWRFDGSNGPLATKTWHGQVALTAGAATIDLTALVDPILGTISMSGLKLLGIHATPDSGNAHTIGISAGASNGYSGWGAIVDNGALGPLPYTSAIDGTHKNLDIAGNGTEKLNLILLFG
jgi:hypothetical protein